MSVCVCVSGIFSFSWYLLFPPIYQNRFTRDSLSLSFLSAAAYPDTLNARHINNNQMDTLRSDIACIKRIISLRSFHNIFIFVFGLLGMIDFNDIWYIYCRLQEHESNNCKHSRLSIDFGRWHVIIERSETVAICSFACNEIWMLGKCGISIY